MINAYDSVVTVVAEVLGVEPADILSEADFELDLNATFQDLVKIKGKLEESLEIVLPDFNEEPPLTIADLVAMVEDGLL